MANLIAIPLQNSQITAIVTWHYPKPFEIQPDLYSNPRTWIIRQGAIELTRSLQREQVLEYLETQRAGIVMPARISNIEFLKSDYKPEALKIYGIDLAQIEEALTKIPGRTYKDAEEILTDCTPIYSDYDY